MDAITILKNDHRKVERLFERYRSIRAADEKRRTLATIARELSGHMAAEERELYPLLRRTISDGPSLMEEATKEHQEAKALLADLIRTEAGTMNMDAKVATLRNAIDHHVREEEDEIFPKMRQTFGRGDLQSLGRSIANAKKVAPSEPPAGAAARSPGASVRGIAAAVTNRVGQLFTPDETRARPGSARATKRPTRSSQAKTARTKSARTKPATRTKRATRTKAGRKKAAR